MDEKKERIAKTIAAAGACSRRDAERWIAAGRVSVNGQVLATPACLVGADDVILVDGRPLNKREAARVWLYHKPPGLVTTHRDPQGRPAVFDHLPPGLPRVVSVGRLDLSSEGLLVLTNSGALARQMELPSSRLERVYRVRVHGAVTAEIIGRLRKGVKADGVHYAPCVARVEKKQGSHTWLTLTLTEGKNREIRKLMAFFGLSVARLIRVSYGPFELGDLPRGAVREVSADLLGEPLCA
ncbi:MAG: pseudouridine synthase [Alphaproteobacteria bacterium]|nr:pseudouridine synthase [Alphaproteobacteria bacterium]